MGSAPPRPPKHGENGKSNSGMPDGNYDIFIIPPHSAGSGFLYLPSLQVQRNSFLAGVACTLLAVGMYTLVMPALKEFLYSITAGGGLGVLILIVGVGIAAWAFGKTQGEGSNGPGFAGFGGGSASGTGQQQYQSTGTKPGPQPNGYAPPPPPPPPQPEPRPSAASGWEKAREETRKREEARKREEEAKKKRDEAQKAKEEAERATKAKAEKDKWEQARAREKEQREREARERIAREREAREKANTSAPRSSPNKPGARYEKPSARSFTGTEDEYSYRPYDSPKKPGHKSSASSVSGLSEGSYAPSHTTARTTPPPSQRGPYSTRDPDKIQIKAVYLFTDSFPLKPQVSLVSKQGPVTDGLILHIKTEGLFIDDELRGVPQREWDVKAWTLKLVEDGMAKNNKGEGLHVLRVTARDAENKKYTFVLDESEAWKVAVGVGRLRKGSQVRSLGMTGIKDAEVRALLGSLGWM